MNFGESHLPEQDGPTGDQDSYPIGFKVAVGLTALYLLYRLFQGVAWLVSRVSG